MQTTENHYNVTYTTLARLSEGDVWQYPDEEFNHVASVDIANASLLCMDYLGNPFQVASSDEIIVLKKIPSGEVSSLKKELIGETQPYRERKPVSRG